MHSYIARGFPIVNVIARSVSGMVDVRAIGFLVKRVSLNITATEPC